nr:MAG: nonstructural protein [Canine astrovirus]
MCSTAPFFRNQADQDFSFGSTMARRMMTVEMINSLPDFEKDTPLHYDWVVKHLIFPGPNTTDRCVVITGGLDNGNYVTVVHDGVNWREVQPPYKFESLLRVLRMTARNKSLRERLRASQEEKSTLILEHQLLRHDYERIKGQVNTSPKIKIPMFVIFVAALVIFLNLVPITEAAQTYTKKVTTTGTEGFSILDKCSENVSRLNREIQLRLKLALGNITWADRYGALKEVFFTNLLPRSHWVVRLFSFLSNFHIWTIFSISIALATLTKSTNPIVDIIFLFFAHVSRWQLGIVPALPYFTTTLVWVAITCMGAYTLDPYLAITLTWIQLPFCVICLSFLSDDKFIEHVRGSFILTVTATAIHTCLVLTGSTTYCFILLMFFRSLRLLVSSVGNKIEFKDFQGKVVGSISTGARNRVWNFVQRMKQVRTGSNPFAIIKPEALVKVITDEGCGTGFFCGNDIVTAGHVVGSHRVVEVWYEGSCYQARVRYRPDKDIAFLALPGDLKPKARYKISQQPDYSTVVVLAYSSNGLVVSQAQGQCHGETISYTVPTQDGMSGAPVADLHGRVLGVHQTNTGFTGGAVVLKPSDVTPPARPTEDDLRKQIEELRKQLEEAQSCDAKLNIQEEVKKQIQENTLQQSTNGSEIISLVREAVQREMDILRQELNQQLMLQKKKGKNKGGGRGNVRKHVGKVKGRKYLTEKEYKELLEKGLDREELLDLIDDIIDKRIGFPEWSDPEISDDEDDPYGNDVEFDHREVGWQSKACVKKEKQPKEAIQCTIQVQEVTPLDEVVISQAVECKDFTQHWGKEPVFDSYNFDWTADDAKNILPDNSRLTKCDSIVLGSHILKLRHIITTALETNNFSELPKAVFALDHFAWDHGLEGFLQRIKSKKPKNVKGAPKGAPKNGN